MLNLRIYKGVIGGADEKAKIRQSSQRYVFSFVSENEAENGKAETSHIVGP
jgi:hypothetical protein